MTKNGIDFQDVLLLWQFCLVAQWRPRVTRPHWEAGEGSGAQWKPSVLGFLSHSVISPSHVCVHTIVVTSFMRASR